MTSKSDALSRRSRINRILTPYWFVLPVAVVILLVIAYPVVNNISMSFFQNYLARPTQHAFIWFENYKELFEDRIFWRSTRITGIYIVVSVAMRFLLGLGVAILLNEKVKFRGLFRALIIIPWAIPDIVAGLVWIQMYDYQYGIFNYYLMHLGLISEPLKWLSSTTLALPAAIVLNIWKGFPWVAIMILAGLQSIPEDLYEAASMDGANTWQRFMNVTVPSLRPVFTGVFLLLVIWTIKDFAIVYILNKGGPAHATEVLTIFIYQKAFTDLRMGQAAAGGTLLLLVSMIFTITYLKVVNKGEAI